ncbi:MAG: ATP-binding protein, partial [Actinomycetes bacterium]
AREVAAAVGAALANVAAHAGEAARAWVLLEDDGDDVVVSVRDDGRGFTPSRLTEAREEGRLGVAASIEGRVRDLGGTMAVESAPGAGTEVELRVPR